FSTLDSNAQHLVRIAAVIGTRSPRGWLTAATELPSDEASAAARAAVDAGILVIDSGGRGYTFAHALLREAILAELVPNERTSLPDRAARALDNVTVLDDDVDLVTERARHWDAAERPAEALRWTITAAEQANDRYAFAAALALYGRALQWWAVLPEAPS